MSAVRWSPGSGWGVVAGGSVAWLDQAWPTAWVAAAHDQAGHPFPAWAAWLAGIAPAPFAAAGPSATGGLSLVSTGAALRWETATGVRDLSGEPGTPRQAEVAGAEAVEFGHVVGHLLPFTGGVVACGGLRYDCAADRAFVPPGRDGPAPQWPPDVHRASPQSVGGGPGPVLERADAPAGMAPVAAAMSPPSQPESVDDDNPFADMWGRTQLRSVEQAAVRQTPGAGEAAPARETPPPRPAAAPPSQATWAWQPGDESVADPILGRAVAGDVSVDLVGTVVIGRAPTPLPGEACGLLKVPSPERGISRNHAVLRVVDHEVVALDLGSNNGTTLRRPGRPASAVGADSPTPVHHGDELDLGEGVTVRLIGLP